MQQELILPDGWDGYGSPAVPLTNVLARLWSGVGPIPTPPNDVRVFGAVGDGVADNAAAFREADQWCANNGMVLEIPAGRYLFSTPFSGTTSPYTSIRASWHGAGRNLTALVGLHDTTYRTFRLGYGSGTTDKMRAQSRSEPSPFAPVYAISDAVAGQRFVAFTTPAELTTLVAAGGIAVGQLWHVAAGKNVQDADDPLWYYDQLHRVEYINTVAGRVYFEDALDYVLTSQGWDGSGAGKNLAMVYANATAYTAGQYVWDNVATSTLYVATTSGTSNNANRSADTGVVWAAVTTALAALKTGAVDHRPVFQKSYSQVQDLTFSDLTIDWAGAQGATVVELSGAYNIQYDRCIFRNHGVYIPEASRNIIFRDCDFDRSAPDGTNAARNAVSLYNARKVKLVNCRINGGNTSTVSVGNRTFKLESYGELILENCTVSNADTLASQGYMALIDRGEFIMRGGTAMGYRDPVRFSVARLSEEVGTIIPFAADIQGVAPFQIRSLNFRNSAAAGEDTPPTHYRPNNVYLLHDVYSSGAHIQTNGLRFAPTRYATATVSFAVLTSQTSLVVDLTDAALADLGATSPDALSMIFLGWTIIWTTPGTNDLTLRPRAKHVSSAVTRTLLGSADANNLLIVNSATPAKSKFAGAGDTHRWLQSGVDRFQFTYTSGASAGGTCNATLHALV